MSDTGSFRRAMTYAQQLLSYRPRTSVEVRTKLLEHFSSPITDKVLASLGEQSLINDEEFADLWVESRQSTNPRSTTLLKHELLSKGISKNIAEQILKELNDDDNAYRAALRHSKKLHHLDCRTFSRKMWGFLIRRGFTDCTIRKTVRQLQSDCETE